jgi:hypothetical protein
MKKYLIYGGILLAGAGAGGGFYAHRTASPPPYSCTAGQNEQCASDQWYQDYERFVALRTELNPKPKLTADQVRQKTDEMQGILNRLRIDAPSGFDWDEKKLRFVKRPSPPPPPVPVK